MSGKELKINSWMKVIAIINKHKISHIHKYLNIESLTVHCCIKSLEKHGLIIKHSIGREKMIELTDKGKKIQKKVITLLKEFNDKSCNDES